MKTDSRYTEEQLIDGCVKGERLAQKALYDAYAPILYPICVRYVGRETGKDVLQDGFITIFDKIGTYKGEGSFEGWMRRIIVNTALMQWGWIDQPIEFLTIPNNWIWVYFVVNIWKDTGWGTILFLATLSGISPDLYEAADIDGAGRFQKLWYITLPALANTIITVFILNLAKVMNLFESVFVMYNASVYSKADVIQTYIYRQSFSGGIADYGYTTAVGLCKSLVGCILVLICNKASKKVRGRGII